MPITPEELKKLRKSLGLTQEEAAKSIYVTLRSWQNWETKKGMQNHRVIQEGLLELFFIKHNISYKVLADGPHLVYK